MVTMMIIQVGLPLAIKDINKYKHLPFIRGDHDNERNGFLMIPRFFTDFFCCVLKVNWINFPLLCFSFLAQIST